MRAAAVTDLPRWYVMLALDQPPPAAYTAAAGHVAATTGGQIESEPHVTVAYLHGDAPTQAVGERLAALQGPEAVIAGESLFSFRETPHPLFGYGLSLRIGASAALYHWHAAAVTALQPLPLALTLGWDEGPRHMRLVHHMALPPAAALRRLGDRPHPLAVSAASLWVTRLADGRFTEVLRRPL